MIKTLAMKGRNVGGENLINARVKELSKFHMQNDFCIQCLEPYISNFSIPSIFNFISHAK